MKTLLAAAIAALTALMANAVQEREVLRPLPVGTVQAKGWALELLKRNRAGLGGHFGSFDPNQFEKPYATRDYNARLNQTKPKDEYPGWCAEMAGEYRLGQIELALMLEDAGLRADFRRWMCAAMSLQAHEPEGYLGAYRDFDDRLEGYNPWGAQFAFRAMLVEYGATGDQAIIEAVRRGLRWFADVWWVKVKARGKYWDDNPTANVLYGGPAIIGVASDVYRLTGDERLRTFAEGLAEATEKQADWSPRNWQARGGFRELSLERGCYHTVAYATRGELPAALYAGNGDEKCLKAAVDICDNHIARVGWMANYAPRCANEHTSPPNCIGETEYCSFICWMEYLQRLARVTGDARYGERIERMTFNGAMGARKKDERAIAYNSSPNQLLATATSSNEGCLPYYCVYAPCLFAACCPAQSIRLIPEYLAMSVMQSRTNDLTVLAYGPCRIVQKDLTIDEETDYPFSGKVKFRISARNGWKGALRLRNPGWATSVTLARNCRRINVPTKDGWIVVEGPWSDDELDVEFGMKPVVLAASDEFSTEPFRVIECGPLAFVQHLQERWTEVEPQKPSAPLPEGWAWYEARPAEEPVIYAMPPETAFDASRIEIVRGVSNGYPWEDPPVRLKVPMMRASRAYVTNAGKDGKNYRPVANPTPADDDAKLETVELVPYGATNLRIMYFPLVSGNVANKVR